MKPVVAIGGSIAQRPDAGGHAWVFGQYLLGFRRLGFDVVFVDHLDDDDAAPGGRGATSPSGTSANLGYLRSVMESFGLSDDWALLVGHGRRSYGMERAALLERLQGAELMLNVMGYIDDEEVLDAVDRRVFLDIDPGFGQMWRALGLADVLARHDHHVTIGERIGRPDCAVPTCGLAWITTKQPVVLQEWPSIEARGDRYTSVGSWRGPFGPIDFEGTTYGLRVHEFRRFLELPAATGCHFEMALDIDPAERADLERLVAGGWALVDPTEVAGHPRDYRRYVQRSKAELMVAKHMYVASRSGWFSDRSACYLASGRPVVAQDTGLASLLPTGEGLLTFEDLDGAVAAVEAVEADWGHHARAARRIAENHFDSDLVLPRLLAALGVALPDTDRGWVP